MRLVQVCGAGCDRIDWASLPDGAAVAPRIRALRLADWTRSARFAGPPIGELARQGRRHRRARADRPRGGRAESRAAWIVSKPSPDYALECRGGLQGFKIHGWHDGDKQRKAAVVLAVREAVA
jgi:hypothetical protein